MYRIPDDLDLSYLIGRYTSQIGVGQFDLQFRFDEMMFAIYSRASVYKGKDLAGNWEPEKWPDSCFYEIMNVNVIRTEVVDKRVIRIFFENSMSIEMVEDEDPYESMRISIGEKDWII